MRRIIKEQLDELKFKKIRKMILSLLKDTVLPKYDWVCKFDVERIPESNLDGIMVIIYLRPGVGHRISQDNKYKLIDEIWEYVWEWTGIGAYEKFVNIDHCDKENITESRINKIMTDYFNEIFNIAEINWRNPWEIDEDGNEYEDNLRTEFYYGTPFDDDVVFRYYDKGYFREGSKGDRESPILFIEGEPGLVLNGYFGNKWQEPFKLWFREHFGLNIKTVDTQELYPYGEETIYYNYL